MKIRLEVLPHQEEFIFSTSKHTGLIGGYGSGKSYAGVLKTVLKKLKYPGIDVAYYLPTYGLIRDIAFPKFSEILRDIGVEFRLNKSDKEIITPYGRIILRSMDKPESIIGYEVGYSLVDETDILPQRKMTDVFAMIVGRNRSNLPKGDINCTDVVGTPEGFKWAYQFFVRDKSPNRKIIKAKTKDNPFNPPDYLSTLQGIYSPQQLEAYTNGEFVNLTSGNVYRNYDRLLNYTSRTAQPGHVLHVGMDFNITKMNAVIHIEDEGNKYAVDEVVNAYDTQELCELLLAKYTGHKIIVYPDAAGNARKTNSKKSDHDIIRSYGFVIRAGKANPAVRDRVTTMNLAFKDKNGNARYFVNDEQCPNYAEALEKQTYKNGEPDKSSGYDHITEAGGYYVYNSGKQKMKYGIS